MSNKINNPHYKKVGAFWIEGHNDPFYGLHEAKDYQLNNGGDILNYRGEVIIHEPEAPAIVEEVTTQVHTKKKGFWNLFGLLG